MFAALMTVIVMAPTEGFTSLFTEELTPEDLAVSAV